MAVGDIYCLKMFQTYAAQVMLNVFFYEQTIFEGTTDAKGLFDAFNAKVLAEWKDTVTNQVDITKMEVFNPEDPTDWHDATPSNNQGTRVAPAGERSPSFLAFGFRSNREGPGTRASYKRFGGLMESDMDSNSLSTAFTTLQAVIDLADEMANTIVKTASDSAYRPVQVKHPVPLQIPVVVNFDITSWSSPYLTSQVSRRAPSGV